VSCTANAVHRKCLSSQVREGSARGPRSLRRRRRRPCRAAHLLRAQHRPFEALRPRTVRLCLCSVAVCCMPRAPCFPALPAINQTVLHCERSLSCPTASLSPGRYILFDCSLRTSPDGMLDADFSSCVAPSQFSCWAVFVARGLRFPCRSFIVLCVDGAAATLFPPIFGCVPITFGSGMTRCLTALSERSRDCE